MALPIWISEAVAELVGVPLRLRAVVLDAKVTAPLKVLAPAKVCTPVVTKPGKEASALCKYRELPAITAPLALLVCESMVPIVVTPDELPNVSGTQLLPFHIKVADTPGERLTLPIVKLAVPTSFTYTTRPEVVLVGLGRVIFWPPV